MVKKRRTAPGELKDRDSTMPAELSDDLGKVQLTHVTLRQFKAAFKPDPIGLHSFNVLIGRNGSGKSTLLEALQWIDTSLRRDARDACNRYGGSRDLINLRSRLEPPTFGIEVQWQRPDSTDQTWKYSIQVEDRAGVPAIAAEQLSKRDKATDAETRYISTEAGLRRLGPMSSDSGATVSVQIRETDRPALARIADLPAEPPGLGPESLLDFWSRAVFLRLSPSRLASGSAPTRKSFEPILDEEGQNLPALLNELSDELKQELVAKIQEILPGMKGIEVSEPDSGRSATVHYSLKESMPYRGRSGRQNFKIPAWMLSEGTRRLTAILALLTCQPAPSLLCIEEIENGPSIPGRFDPSSCISKKPPIGGHRSS